MFRELINQPASTTSFGSSKGGKLIIVYGELEKEGEENVIIRKFRLEGRRITLEIAR